jgi:hypothetical protein
MFVWLCHFGVFWSCLGLFSWELNFFAKLSKSILALSNGCETWWSCSWCQYEAIEYLKSSFWHVYHPMLNFVYLRSSRLKVLHFWLDSCIANKGDKFELEMTCWMHLKGFQVVSSHFWVLVCNGLTGRGHRSDRSKCWSCAHVEHRSDRWWWPVWLVRAELLQLLCFKWCFPCIRPGGVALVQGEPACEQGELFVVFELWFGGLPSLLEHSFVSDVSSRCPCLRGPKLAFFKWSCSLPLFGFRSLVGVSFCSFLFFFFSLVLHYVGVVSALIKGEVEDHVWFEDRWMVASLCDEWLTTLCGLTLG